MKIAVASFKERGEADALVVPVWEGEPLEDVQGVGHSIRALASTKDFKAKLGEVLFLYQEGHLEPRLVLVGLGKAKKGSDETLRRAYAAAVKALQAKQLASVHILLPKREGALQPCAEGVFLTNYAFTRLKEESAKDSPTVLLSKVTFLNVEPQELVLLEKLHKIALGVHFVRDLVNSNADDKTAPVFAKIAKDFEKSHSKIQTTILDKKRLEQEKMGLLLAVNRGSNHEPCMIIASYQGDPESKEHTVLVGKGMSYDSGGLNLKPGDGMLTMKCDMAGAATVLSAVRTAADLGLKVNVTAVAPIAENCIDAASYKPGDVYRSYLGKTVEITNTDAEGRLILADAMSYAVKNLKPTALIDLATLTGAIVIALGEDMAGLFATDETLAKELLEASKASGELLWRMPVHEDYLEGMKSEIADLVNSGSREGSSIKAALFLHEFVDKVPWAHLDIAGSAYHSKPRYYHTSKATGFGVRLLIELLERKMAR